MRSDLERLGRDESWLWTSALAVTLLSGTAFLLSFVHSLFLHRDRFFEIGSDQARWATLSLLLIFNAWLLFREWSFRRERRQLSERDTAVQSAVAEVQDFSSMDSVTGLYTRTSIDRWLGKAVVRAKRQNVPLSLVALHLDDFVQLSSRYGRAAGDQILTEFANRLRKAIRGSDFGVRLESGDFLLVLPECSLRDAKTVSDRLGTLEMKVSGEDVELTYSVGWIDYKLGEVPSDLMKRAGDMLQLYKKAS